MIDIPLLHPQNGLDNSGNTGHYNWYQSVATSTTPAELTYEHWNIRGGDWAGNCFIHCHSLIPTQQIVAGYFNTTSKEYTSINSTNILASLQVVDLIVERYRNNEVVVGITPGKF